MPSKDLYQVQETLKKLYEFSTVWVDWAYLGSQKLFSKLTSVLPRKTQDNFEIDIEKYVQITNRIKGSFSNVKRNLGSIQ